MTVATLPYPVKNRVSRGDGDGCGTSLGESVLRKL